MSLTFNDKKRRLPAKAAFCRVVFDALKKKKGIENHKMQWSEEVRSMRPEEVSAIF